ncbi:hypothetical protein HC752_09920 [Vibrio sp. S9_S30]|uniref:hypothetical protein n=1 Tax=Vibrio sp. S9_S30 TaxID=2720226 RepID=UPI00168101A4|nr:hypothetical protein [Vibrio sp. S9_S30]MBD1557259.1 hypothetical protein [Vibrio sp. S9_S30]
MTESVEESQVATFDDAFNPYKNYLQDMSLSLAGMPDDAFTRPENQQECSTAQVTPPLEPLEPEEITTNTSASLSPKSDNSRQHTGPHLRT